MNLEKSHRRTSSFVVYGGILAAIFFAVSSHASAAEPVIAVMKTSMGDIQGGGFDAQLKEKATRKPIQNESNNGLRNKKYFIAMARTSDPDSASSQFFINTTDNSLLDRDRARDGVGYAVFGRVVSGQEVVDAIESAATRTIGPLDDVPVKPIVIESVTILEASK